jgi:hypothetical protein
MNRNCHNSGFLQNIVPARSTFCFKHDTRAFLSQHDLIALKRQWDTFERVENYNSIVYSTINGSESPANLIFYSFLNQSELDDYKLGQANHVSEYPNVADFLTSYSKKPIIPKNSTIVSTVVSPYISPLCCPEYISTNVISNAELLANKTAKLIYERVSTQAALFPKSPYKFSGASEYLVYKQYRDKYAC